MSLRPAVGTGGGSGSPPPPGAWGPDVLGDGYQALTLPLAPDDEGEVVATLVRRARPAGPARSVVLYVHGWSDYFFQRELADFWMNRGAAFYALDLRKYGRSLRAHQTPGDVGDLATYDEDLATALQVVRSAEGAEVPLLLMGHSTGGLTLSLWAHRHPGAAAGLVLNSPWLELQTGAAQRRALSPIAHRRAVVAPRGPMPVVDRGFNTRTTSAALEGEWDYDPRWRPPHGFALHPRWLAAVLDGHAAVAAGLDVGCPVLVLLSTRSVLRLRYEEAMARADVAVDVDLVARRAVLLGRSVTVVRLADALHDVVLSAPAVRARAYAEVARWADAYTGTGDAGGAGLSGTPGARPGDR